MAIVALKKWGNSLGICLPMTEIKVAKAYVGEEFILQAKPNGGFTLEPVKNPQTGWLEAFNRIADKNNEELVCGNIENDFDKDDWEW